MSQIGPQTVTINILVDISKRRENQTMKFGQLMEYNVINISLKKSWEKKAGRLVPNLFLFFQKTLYEVKTSIIRFSLLTMLTIIIE